MDTNLLYDLIKLAGSTAFLIISIFWYYSVAIKPKRKAKNLYLKVMEQYSPLGALRICIEDAGNGSLKLFPFKRKHCYLLLYKEEISVVTIDEPLIRVNIPVNYFKSYQIVKKDYIQFSYIENNKVVEFELEMRSSDDEIKNFNKYALKQFDYYKYFETHISKGDQSPTIINL